jgi:hypothetical protein
MPLLLYQGTTSQLAESFAALLDHAIATCGKAREARGFVSGHDLGRAVIAPKYAGL